MALPKDKSEKGLETEKAPWYLVIKAITSL